MHRILEYAREAIDALWRNRTRSILTMLGMIIGSSSIIAVFGISKGATSGIAATFASFGTAPIFVAVDRTQDYPAQAAIQYRDAAPVTDAVDGLAANVQPVYQKEWQVSSGSKRDYIQVSSDGSYHPDTLAMSEGHKINDDDLNSAAHVCALTADVAREFFPGRGAVGSELRINGRQFVVVGVYADIKGSFFNSLFGSNAVVIPYTTFHNIAPGPVDGILIYPNDPSQSAELQAIAKRALQHIHGERALYNVQDISQTLTTFQSVLSIVGTALSAIGGVALVVAGIGIMNIMLVSVTERTREIGIRKSIGASRRDIALQFLMEAVMLALFGGGTGMALGLFATIGAASLISKQLGEVIIPYLLIVSIALTFSMSVGLIFGTYPALRAAAMDPIEALRS
jgi:putative ABC transport system permease protein